MNEAQKRLEEDLDKVMQANLAVATASAPLKQNGSKPNGVKDHATVISEATNKDSERTTRSMLEHHMKIAEGLERQIAEAHEIRETVLAYISDLSTALNASKATIEVLTKK